MDVLKVFWQRQWDLPGFRLNKAPLLGLPL